MKASRAQACECDARGRRKLLVVVSAPTVHPTVATDSAGMRSKASMAPGGHASKSDVAIRRGRLAMVVISPAQHMIVASANTTGMISSCAQACECDARGRHGLPGVVIAPTVRPTVVTDSTGMHAACAQASD